MDEKKAISSIDEYIVQFPPELQKTLQQLRQAIRQAAPEAQERMNWQMPTFFLEGNLVHFAAHKHHIGFYPAASGIDAFAQQLSAYRTSKGAVQFPLDKPLPYDIIRQMVAFRVQENLRAAREKQERRK